MLRDVQQKMADVATVAEENIVGVHVVKSFAQEQAEQDKFERRSEAVFTQSVRANRQRAFYVPVLSFMPLLGQAAVLLVGGRMVAHHTLSIADFVSLQPLPHAADLPAAHARNVDRRGPARDRVRRADLPGDRRGRGHSRRAGSARSCPPGQGACASSGVTFGYDPERPVLHDVDLELERREDRRADRPHRVREDDACFARAAVLRRAARPRDGRRRRRARRDAHLAARREIGVIAQDPFLFSATVRENISFGRPDATDEEIEEAARLAQAHEFIAELPDGYDTVIGERGITLSGGQRQRVAIARALVVDPRILILDDATASVDATTEAKIRDGLREAMRGRTTIIIAHRLSTIALADEIVVLEDGRVAARGTHDDLIDDERHLPRDLRARPLEGLDRRTGSRPEDASRAAMSGGSRCNKSGTNFHNPATCRTFRRPPSGSRCDGSVTA